MKADKLKLSLSFTSFFLLKICKTLFDYAMDGDLLGFKNVSSQINDFNNIYINWSDEHGIQSKLAKNKKEKAKIEEIHKKHCLVIAEMDFKILDAKMLPPSTTTKLISDENDK